MQRNRLTTENLSTRTHNCLFVLLLCVTCCLTQAALAAPPTAGHWVGSWATTPMAGRMTHDTPSFSDATLREIVRPTITGEALRVRFTNEFGIEPLTISAAHIALSASNSTIVPSTDHAITFNGQPSITIPPGAYVLSDAVPMATKPFTPLAISIYFPAQQISSLTYHPRAQQTGYLAEGNEVQATSLNSTKTFTSWYFLKGVDVETANPRTAAVVAFGDSITDGYGSNLNANSRWPDLLADKLQANPSTRTLSVLNEGLSGNRLLRDGAGPSALARFDRDVLAQAGVRYLIVLEGINDIGRLAYPNDPQDAVTAVDLEKGLAQIVARAHEHGIIVYGATLTPYQGAAYYSQAGEGVREAVNHWIRTSRVFDGVIDFNKALADPLQPLRILPAYDHGGHLHPNDIGYKAMARAIPLQLFIP